MSEEGVISGLRVKKKQFYNSISLVFLVAQSFLRWAVFLIALPVLV